MTRTQYYVAASIDGYIADRTGSLDWLFQFNDVPGLLTDHYRSFVAQVGAVAMGASTLRFMLDQGLTEWPYPDARTWVFTHGNPSLPPGADVVLTADDVGEVHAQMVEAAAGRNIWLVGGGELVAQFADRGLLDEIWLGVAPVVLGGGVPVLPTRLPGVLTLTDVTRFGAGFLELRYSVPHAEGGTVAAAEGPTAGTAG